jgi:hypothetical protein
MLFKVTFSTKLFFEEKKNDFFLIPGLFRLVSRVPEVQGRSQDLGEEEESVQLTSGLPGTSGRRINFRQSRQIRLRLKSVALICL